MYIYVSLHVCLLTFPAKEFCLCVIDEKDNDVVAIYQTDGRKFHITKTSYLHEDSSLH
jgi:hypothetical protein